MSAPRIVLATINAKYIHSAFGLRCLLANLGPLAESTQIIEFTGGRRPVDMAEEILAARPTIVGLGVYIWNATQSLELVEVLRRVAPDVVLVLGGPEVSHEVDAQAITSKADFVITGEGETALRQLCERLGSGRRPLQPVIAGGLPDLDALALPYAMYDAHDIAHRVIYVEASRGCPYRCEFCLSSLDQKVRAFPLEPFLDAMRSLLDRGARRFKFVDRTFNLDVARSEAILRFFLERVELGLFLHFELVPDRLPDRLRALISEFPPGSLQFEIGIQTLDPEVGARISRRQDLAKTQANLEFLRTQTHVHLHTDLIIGLPGETAAQFGRGLDHLVGLRVQEIQVGVLKRLRGTPITRHDEEHGMVYAAAPPYEVLRTRAIDFGTMQALKRFAHLWGSVVNEGNFRASSRAVWGEASPFAGFSEFSGWLYARRGRVHAISLKNLARDLVTFLADHRGLDVARASDLVRADFVAAGRKDPGPLTGLDDAATAPTRPSGPGTPPRQARHGGPDQ